MYRTRRPAPSPAALRVLYQLAYISSGTAVGLAALCAEERRRRIQIVQRIADNAKAIRASSRYNHTAALAVNDGDDGFVPSIGGGWTPEHRTRRRRRRIARLDDTNEEGVKGPELPSVVEDQYAERAASKTGIGLAFEQDAHHGSSQSAERAVTGLVSSEPKLRQRTAFGKHPSLTPSTGGSVLRPTLAPAPKGEINAVDHSRENLLYKILRRDPGAGQALMEVKPFRLTSSPASDLTRWKSQFGTAFNKILQPETHQPDLPVEYKTRSVWFDQDSDLSGIAADAVTQDTNIFFNQKSISSSGDVHQVKEAADQLLILAVRKGLLDDLRSLCLWKLATAQFTSLDAGFLTEHCDSLVSEADPHDVLDLFGDIFASSAFHQFEFAVRAKHALRVLASAITWDVEVKTDKLAFSLLDRALGSFNITELTEALDTECRIWLAKKDVSTAVELVLLITEYRYKPIYRLTPARLTRLASELFDAAIDAGQLSFCLRLLPLIMAKIGPDVSPKQVNTFVQICADRGAYDTLRKLLRTYRKSNLVSNRRLLYECTDEASKAILAVACSSIAHDSSSVYKFQSFYRELAPHAQSFVLNGAAAMALRSTWKATRNLAYVQSQYDKLEASRTQVDRTESSKDVDDALLEIYIEANKLDLALQTIARMHSNGEVRGRIIGLAALLFAKRRSWDRLARLLEIAETSASTEFDAETTRVFNKVIHLFSQQHSAAETWKFVTAMMDKLGFSPDLVTTRIILRSFVIKKSLRFISGWLRLLKTLGHEVELGAKDAAQLLTAYYIECRPTYKNVFWQVYNLRRQLPSLAPEPFLDLLKEAFGYDVKSLTSSRQPSRRIAALKTLAEHRIERLEKAKGQLSSSGWNHDLTKGDGASWIEGSEQQTVLDRSISSAKASIDMLQSSGLSVSESSAMSYHYAPDDDSRTFEDDLRESEPRDKDFANSWVPSKTAKVIELGSGDRQGLASKSQHTSLDVEAFPKFPEAFSWSDLAESKIVEPLGHADPSLTGLRLTQDRESLDENEMHQDLGQQGFANVEREMTVALFLGQDSKVVEIYRRSVDAVGLPASVRALELAVQASIRQHGNRFEAESILASAREAGMNVACAMGPIIVQQMRELDSVTKIKESVNSLRTTVIEYYRINDTNGLPVNHTVATSAANALIDHGYAQHGLNILSAVYRSEWAANRPLDTIAMTVFLKGYSAARSVSGINWVVQTVLSQNMRITSEFMQELKSAVKGSVRRRFGMQNKCLSRGAEGHILHSIEQCQQRRLEQASETRELGGKLVKCLVECIGSQKQPANYLDSRQKLDDHIFGKDDEPSDFSGDMGSPFPNPESSHSVSLAPPDPDVLDAPKIDIAFLDNRHNPRYTRRRARILRMEDDETAASYRAFVERRLLTHDGKQASFRLGIVGGPPLKVTQARRKLLARKRRPRTRSAPIEYQAARSEEEADSTATGYSSPAPAALGSTVTYDSSFEAEVDSTAASDSSSARATAENTTTHSYNPFS